MVQSKCVFSVCFPLNLPLFSVIHFCLRVRQNLLYFKLWWRRFRQRSNSKWKSYFHFNYCYFDVCFAHPCSVTICFIDIIIIFILSLLRKYYYYRYIIMLIIVILICLSSLLYQCLNYHRIMIINVIISILIFIIAIISLVITTFAVLI